MGNQISKWKPFLDNEENAQNSSPKNIAAASPGSSSKRQGPNLPHSESSSEGVAATDSQSAEEEVEFHDDFCVLMDYNLVTDYILTPPGRKIDKIVYGTEEYIYSSCPEDLNHVMTQVELGDGSHEGWTLVSKQVENSTDVNTEAENNNLDEKTADNSNNKEKSYSNSKIQQFEKSDSLPNQNGNISSQNQSESFDNSLEKEGSSIVGQKYDDSKENNENNPHISFKKLLNTKEFFATYCGGPRHGEIKKAEKKYVQQILRACMERLKAFGGQGISIGMEMWGYHLNRRMSEDQHKVGRTIYINYYAILNTKSYEKDECLKVFVYREAATPLDVEKLRKLSQNRVLNSQALSVKQIQDLLYGDCHVDRNLFAPNRMRNDVDSNYWLCSEYESNENNNQCEEQTGAHPKWWSKATYGEEEFKKLFESDNLD